jgi:two-component system sensor histidine kinase/response regulator
MSPVRTRRPAGSVMVVDDNLANLKLMGDMLGRQGYEVRLFPRGRMALASALQRPPDLILLDINMPEMDGYDVCRRLKADASLAPIPVVFLSALQETEDKVKGLRCGGVDYISKPFQLEEVQARVETQLKIYALQRQLQVHNERLEEMVAARTRELVEAHARLTILDRAKGDFLSLISHEFRTPLNGLLGAGSLALDELPRTKENTELIEMFEGSRLRILSLLNDALLLTQIDVAGSKFQSGPVSCRRVLERVLDMSAGFAEERGISLNAAPIESGLEVIGEEELLVMALHALTEAGVKLTTPGRPLCVRHEVTDSAMRILIESTGQVIPAVLIDKFFDVFSMNEADIHGLNLGLRPAVACRILTLFGGTATIANRDSAGTCLTAVLRTSHTAPCHISDSAVSDGVTPIR